MIDDALVALRTVYSRLKKDLPTVRDARARFKRDGRVTDVAWCEGRIAGFEQAMATCEQVAQELKEAEQLRDDDGSAGSFTNTNRR